MMSRNNQNSLPRFGDLEEDYKILRELGRGGTAVVYLARERALDREVAIKVIRSTYVEDREAAARLMREARTVAQLQHPNIVMLHGVRRLQDDSLALIMQYVPGRSLKQIVSSRGPLPIHFTERVLRDISDALAYAHERRIVHRDIKPENIYLDRDSGLARLADFGIARPWDSDSNLTLPGTALGTPAYMSPEQIDGRDLDGRSDIYSLGMVGYEMLTGRAPWAEENLYRIIYKQKHEELPSLAVARPETPEHLRVAIERALRKAPEARWPGAGEFIAALGGDAAAAGDANADDDGERASPVAGGDATPSAGAGGAGVGTGLADGVGPRTASPESKTIQYRRPDADVDPDADGAAEADRDMKAPARAGSKKPAAAAASGSSSFAAAGLAAAEDVKIAAPAAFTAPDQASGDSGSGPREDAKSRGKRFAIAAALLLVGGSAVALAALRGSDSSVSAASPASSLDDAAGEGLPAAASSESRPGNRAIVPTDIVVLGGDGQEGPVETALPEPLEIRLYDAAGLPVDGARVEFRVQDGGGTVFPSATWTDSAGVARAAWSMGGEPGENVLLASGASGPRTTFTATALPPPPERLAVVRGDDQSGEPATGLGSAISLRVEDSEGNPLEGVPIEFRVESSDGAVSPRIATSDADGLVHAAWTLGSEEGSQSLIAAVADAAGPEAASVEEQIITATAEVPPLSPDRSIVAGGTHSCAIYRDGTSACWGSNAAGQLGDGGPARRSTPGGVAPQADFARIAAGMSHTCAVSVQRRVYCWGANQSGQLGDGTTSRRAQPTPAATGLRFTGVAAGISHTCALARGGAAYCWGDNSDGQLGDGSRTSRSTPVPVSGGRGYRSITTGWTHTCALDTNGRAYCWGRNDFGQLGAGGGGRSTEPVAAAGDIRFRALSAGGSHTCGIDAGGTVHCWGHNSHGQLGSASGSGLVSTRPPTGGPFIGVVTGSVHTCALDSSYTVYCWGRNTHGQLGDGSTSDRAEPSAVAGGLQFTSIHASGSHTCGITTQGEQYCWGYNLEGQLGDGSRSNRSRPVRVGG